MLQGGGFGSVLQARSSGLCHPHEFSKCIAIILANCKTTNDYWKVELGRVNASISLWAWCLEIFVVIVLRLVF
ncbi:hypothetical protein TIFTF001_042613 [Ficus carica]|uniref:Uncharacterized protein n=1 Tax=Ficus carica TaxID=3494 RepID=A0AA88D144_FICCA|nr:hypothetical protein TIFTF001_042613 [Ficus carica]